MSWLGEKLTNAILNFFANVASDLMTNAFNLISNTILKTNNLNEYFNVSLYLVYVQIIAGGLLSVKVVWEVFKQASGGMIPTEEKSIGTYALQVVWGGALIYALPKAVTMVLLPINNALIGLIQTIGVKIEVSQFQKMLGLTGGLASLGSTMIFMMFILGIAFFILGILGGVRYIELLIAILFAPIAATSAVDGGEGIQVWGRETIAVVFTQTIHVLLLQMLISIIGKVDGVMMVVLCLGVIVVMLKGAQLLRTFTYRVGVGSAAVSAVGGAGRMKAMQVMMSAAVPGK